MELLLFRMADQVPLALALVQGPDHGCVWANARFRHLPFAQGLEVVGQNIVALIPDFVARDGVEQLNQVYRDLRPVKLPEYETRLGEPATSNFWDIDLTPLVDDQGNVQGIAISLDDVTPLVLAARREEILAAETEDARRTLEALMKFIPEGLIITEGPDARIRWASDYGVAMTGRPRKTLIEGPSDGLAAAWQVFAADGLTPLPDEELPMLRAARRGEIVTNLHLVLIRDDGVKIPILCNAGPIFSATGRLTGSVTTWRDISALESARDEIRHSQDRLQLALEAARAFAWDWDLGTNQVERSPNARSVIGIAPDSLAASLLAPSYLSAIRTLRL